MEPFMAEKQILIIEDEFPMRYLIEHALKKAGYGIHQAKDGPEGIKKAVMVKPDLIILDVMLPKINGFEVCRQLKAKPGYEQIPIIFLSANETPEYRQRAFEVGGVDYLTKPFEGEELMAHIAAVLRRHQRIETGTMPQVKGQIVSLFSPKGGVGTSTLAIQLAESMVIQEDRPVLLIDLDLPFGGIGPMLYMDGERNILDLLRTPPNYLTISTVKQIAQHRRADMLVITAPGEMIELETRPLVSQLQKVLQLLTENGYLVIIDCGSDLTPLVRAALRNSQFIFVITSGQPVANRLHDEFVASAAQLGIEPKRMLPVVNELYGRIDNIQLARVPVARIPHAGERSRTRLWLKEQGMRKLVSLLS
jgi:pilus assembly protein CpaE